MIAIKTKYGNNEASKENDQKGKIANTDKENNKKQA